MLLVFLKIGVFNTLPQLQEALELPGPTYVSNRGIALPWFEPTATWGAYLLALALAIGAAIIVALWLRRRGERTGRPQLSTL